MSFAGFIIYEIGPGYKGEKEAKVVSGEWSGNLKSVEGKSKDAESGPGYRIPDSGKKK
jgi:hypothetical protein